jgi:hypothetical protein
MDNDTPPLLTLHARKSLLSGSAQASKAIKKKHALFSEQSEASGNARKFHHF